MDPTDFEDEPRRPVSIGKLKLTLTPDQIMTFVAGLHETQWGLIEAMVVSREKQGFPEVQQILKDIKRRL